MELALSSSYKHVLSGLLYHGDVPLNPDLVHRLPVTSHAVVILGNAMPGRDRVHTVEQLVNELQSRIPLDAPETRRMMQLNPIILGDHQYLQRRIEILKGLFSWLPRLVEQVYALATPIYCIDVRDQLESGTVSPYHAAIFLDGRNMRIARLEGLVVVNHGMAATDERLDIDSVISLSRHSSMFSYEIAALLGEDSDDGPIELGAYRGMGPEYIIQKIQAPPQQKQDGKRRKREDEERKDEISRMNPQLYPAGAAGGGAAAAGTPAPKRAKIETPPPAAAAAAAAASAPAASEHGSLVEHLLCSICLGLIFKASRVGECGHTFCCACITKALSSSGARGRRCPECMVPIDTHAKIMPDHRTNNILDTFVNSPNCPADRKEERRLCIIEREKEEKKEQEARDALDAQVGREAAPHLAIINRLRQTDPKLWLELMKSTAARCPSAARANNRPSSSAFGEVIAQAIMGGMYQPLRR